MKPINMAWGHPYFLLGELKKKYKKDKNRPPPYRVSDMIYPPDDGFPELIEQTKELIKDLTGLEYKHVVITAGATQGINSIFKYMKMSGYSSVITTEYGYPLYERMAADAGLDRVPTRDITIKEGDFYLIDSPTNPEGLHIRTSGDGLTTHWDAVYHNNIYTDKLSKYPAHISMIGSYSKCLGLAGARVGWIATNNDLFYDRIRAFVLADIAGVSTPSQKLISDILHSIDLQDFIEAGRNSLNRNREEMSKISHILGPINESGMFYCANVDNKSINLLKKCGILFIRLSNNYIRLSLGQTNESVKNAVNRILKEDSK